jgi:pilus assembly protein Flp/PilA
LLTDRRAVSALEYGLIASLIAVAIITTLVALGMHLSRIFNSIGSYL